MSAQGHSSQPSSTGAIPGMIQGFWVARATCVAAEFGLPHLLKSGPKRIEQLAETMGVHAPSLYQLMRALTSVGVFVEDDQRRFSLTPLGTTLCSGVPTSLRSFAIELFDEAMASFNTVIADAIVDSYDFSSAGTIVDLGGGDGSLLAAILEAHPHLQGVLADLPHVIDGAWQRLNRKGLANRCVVVAADFLKLVPKGDTYLLKWIIHDWDDERSLVILQNGRAAMSNTDKLLLIESIIGPGSNTRFSKFMDLAMLVMTGGRERTEAEYRALLGRAGLRLTRIVPTSTELSLIEAHRA